MANLQLRALDGSALLQESQHTEIGLLNLKRQLFVHANSYVDLPARSLQQVTNVYERCMSEAPEDGIERGLMKIDVTRFVKDLSQQDYQTTLHVRSALRLFFPFAKRFIGAVTLDGLAKEKLTQEIKALFKQRFQKTPEISVTDEKVFLICPYKKLSADFSDMPIDIWMVITLYLRLRDRLALQATCKKLYKSDSMVPHVFTVRGNELSGAVCKALASNEALGEQPLFRKCKGSVQEVLLTLRNLPAARLTTVCTFFQNHRVLTLQNEDLTDTHLNAIARFPRLTKLKLEEFALEQRVEGAFRLMCDRLTQLESLSFVNSYAGQSRDTRRLAVKSPHALLQLPRQLKRLTFEKARVTNIDLWQLGRLTALEMLTIHNYEALGDIYAAGMSQLPVTLRHLELRLGSDLKDANLVLLHRLTALKTLSLSGCRSIEGTHFASLPLSLTSLNCRGTALTQANLNALGRLENLSTFVFSCTQQSHPFAVTDTIQALPQSVRHLSIHWERSILGILWVEYRVHLERIGLQTHTNLTSLDLDIDYEFLNLMTRNDRSHFFQTLHQLINLVELQMSCTPQIIQADYLEQLPPALRTLKLRLHLDDEESPPSAVVEAIKRFNAKNGDCLVTISPIVHRTSSLVGD